MTDNSKDIGVIQALVQRFETQRLPHALAIKKKVDQGDVLSESDLTFLKQVFEDAQHIKPYMDKNPDWQPLFSKAVTLYTEIMDKATANEQATAKPDKY